MICVQKKVHVTYTSYPNITKNIYNVAWYYAVLAFTKDKIFNFLRNISHSGKDFFGITNRKCYSEESKPLSSIEHTHSAYMNLFSKIHQYASLRAGGRRYECSEWWRAIAAGSVECLPGGVTAVAVFSIWVTTVEAVSDFRTRGTQAACHYINQETPFYTNTSNMKTWLDPLRSAAMLFCLSSGWGLHNLEMNKENEHK